MSDATPHAVDARSTGPEMSTVETLTAIFFEPGRVFESFRTKPRFLVASVILLLITILITGVLYMRVDMAQYIRDRIERSPNAAQITDQQKEMQVKFGKSIGMFAVPVAVPITIAAGAAIYLLLTLMFGGSISYKQSLAVWAYSSIPPSVLTAIIALAVLFLKPADSIDPEHLILTNPGAFMSAESSPVLVAILSQFDLIRLFGMFLAALGLRKVAKLSSGAAWAVVLSLWVLGLVLRVGSAALFGR